MSKSNNVDELAQHFESKKSKAKKQSTGKWKSFCKSSCGLAMFAVVLADFSAAYILFFQGNIAMKIVAFILVAHGTIIAANKFVN